MDDSFTPAHVPARQPAPQVVHVAARPGGFRTALGLIAGLFFFGLTLMIGIGFGALMVFAGSSIDSIMIEQTYRDGGHDRIAIIAVEGVIDDYQAAYVHAAVDHVLSDPSVRGAVLRVNSPGGGVTASDEIWYEVERLKQAGLPVVASYGGMAASGGYYISCAADHIVAQETCITGSIGVIAQIFTMEGLMDKVGIKPVTLVATGSPEKAVGNDMFRQWNEQDQQKIITMLDAAYAIFNQRVADGRAHVIGDAAELNGLANGSIYTAEEALEGGLIDSIGYLNDAIAKVESLAGLTPGRASVIRVEEPPTLFGDVLAARQAAASKADVLNADRVRGLVNDLSSPRVMYLMK